MSKKVDIAHYEKAISEKYGEDAVKNPKAGWTQEKEAEYLEQMKTVFNRDKKRKAKEVKQEHEGFFVSSALFNNRETRECEACNCYSLEKGDTVYLRKYACCQTCYIQYVEGREERWLSGWRPKEVEKDVDT